MKNLFRFGAGWLLTVAAAFAGATAGGGGGGGGGSGTVTSITAGAGLGGGTVTTSGTFTSIYAPAVIIPVTQSNSFTANEPVYFNGTNWVAAVNTAQATSIGGVIAVTGLSGSAFEVQIGGVIIGLSGLTPNTLYYVSNVAGTLTTTPPAVGSGNYVAPIELALSTTSAIVNPGQSYSTALIPLSNLATIAAGTILGNSTGGAASATALTVLPTAAVPAFTGDATNIAGSLAMNVGKINGTALSGLATGVLVNTTTTGVPSILTYTGGSLAFSGGNLTLSGDSASPGNSMGYQTNASGVKGWYALSSGSGTVTSVATSAGISGGTITTTGRLSLDLTYSPTWTGLWTFSPTARTSGSAAYMTINPAPDTALTASTEAVGLNFATATRQHATGALALQREILFNGPTYSFVGASTISDAATVAITPPIQGTNATITRFHDLMIYDAGNSASSGPISGALVVGTGTAATNVGIGAGYVNAGTGVTVGIGLLLTNGTVAAVSTLSLSAGSGAGISFQDNSTPRASLTSQGTFTFGTIGSSYNSWGTSGIILQTTSGGTWTNQSGAGTYATATFNSFAQETLAGSAAGYTTTAASLVYVAGTPIVGTNQTFTIAAGLYIDKAANSAASGTIGTAASLYVAGAPTSGGTITNDYAVDVAAGTTFLGGGLTLAGANFSGTVTLTSGSGTITDAAITTTSVIEFSVQTASGTAVHPLATCSAGSATVTGAANDSGTYVWKLIN